MFWQECAISESKIDTYSKNHITVFEVLQSLCHRKNADIQVSLFDPFELQLHVFLSHLTKLHQFCKAKCAKSEKRLRKQWRMVSICWCAISESAISEVRSKGGIAVQMNILDKASVVNLQGLQHFSGKG